VRRLGRGDRSAVLDVFGGLSERSRRQRFHGAKPALGEGEIDALADVGRSGHEAVGAIDLVTGDVVGIARFVRDGGDPQAAEVAFEVVDSCQGAGVGSSLLLELAAIARRDGIERFDAYVVAGNERALALLRRLGRVTRSSFADGAHELVVQL
jgi:ribosomal protein S18 acetylase RimI-like enzyme